MTLSWLLLLLLVVAAAAAVVVVADGSTISHDVYFLKVKSILLLDVVSSSTNLRSRTAVVPRLATLTCPELYERMKQYDEPRPIALPKTMPKAA